MAGRDTTIGTLGRYSEYRPPEGMGRWVDRLWSYRSPLHVSAPPHRVLPHVSSSLCFRYVRQPDGRVVHPEVLFVGPIRRPRVFLPGPGVVMEAVQFKPEWAAHVLGCDPSAHEDLVSLDALDASTRAVIERRALAAVATSGSAFGGLLSWLEDRSPREGPSHWLASTALDKLRGSAVGGGTLPVSRLAGEVGVSERHLRRAIRNHTGMSPKYLQRVMRLNRVVADADRSDGPRWSSLAVRHGFYDQAHLIQDVRDLTGQTPGKLHSERRAEHVRFFQSQVGSGS